MYVFVALISKLISAHMYIDTYTYLKHAHAHIEMHVNEFKTRTHTNTHTHTHTHLIPRRRGHRGGTQPYSFDCSIFDRGLWGAYSGHRSAHNELNTGV
jgi:hypothetical protein